MKKFEANIDALKEILENIPDSGKLVSHPWTQNLFVQEFVSSHPNLIDQNPGDQLLQAVADLFRQMMPASPPKHGLRLDARWSQFGFLAAKYFVPISFGHPVPVSFQDAWEKIDQSILLFVYGESTELSNEEIKLYVLVGNEPEITPISTLSDWHKKGMQRLLEIITARENHLAVAHPTGQVLSKSMSDLTAKKRTRRYVLLTLILVVIGLLVVGGLKAQKIYDAGMLVYNDVTRLQGSIDSSPGLKDIRTAGPLLETLQNDLHAFRSEVGPYLWLGPKMGWLPNYGCELAAAPELMDMATYLAATGVESYQAALPILDTIESNSARVSPSAITEMLVQAQPQFSEARSVLAAVQTTRKTIDVECMSPYVREMFVNRIDPLLMLMDDGLTIATEFPRIVGASSEGPKTYLLLVLNQDELRPTGGFITAAGTLLLQDGRVISMSFENSGDLDDWSKPYPAAPWQLRQYMNSPVLVFRDANWFPDFPTSALYAEYLYSYVSNHSVDGVIAFNQQTLVELLSVLGPVELDGVSSPINADNVIAYMRAAKTPTAEDLAAPDWNNKKFISDISFALMDKLFAGNVQWESLMGVLLNTLDEHHVLLQLDDPSMTELLARRNWDGSIQAGDGDFLMVLDSNIGFNKTNALVQTSLTYDVDLTDMDAPESNLTVAHQNNADSKVPCLQWGGVTLDGQKNYPVDRCYWDYLRIFTVSGTNLLDANPQAIPADWMIRRQSVPARVDLLDDKLEGVQGFGTLKVVPGGQTIRTNFRFALPVSIVRSKPDSDEKIYRLRIQKQPGTLAVPITIRVHFPNRVLIQKVPNGALVQGQNVFIETNLRVDREFEIIFSAP